MLYTNVKPDLHTCNYTFVCSKYSVHTFRTLSQSVISQIFRYENLRILYLQVITCTCKCTVNPLIKVRFRKTQNTQFYTNKIKLFDIVGFRLFFVDKSQFTLLHIVLINVKSVICSVNRRTMTIAMNYTTMKQNKKGILFV